MVAREGDSYSLIESSIVHLPFVGLAGPCCYRKYTLPMVSSLVISPELNNRKQSLLKLELEDLCDLLYTSVILGLVATPG